MQRTIWIMVVLGLALAGCHPAAIGQPDLVVTMINSPVPPVVGPATATVFIRSTDGQPMHGAAVLLEGSSIDPRVSPIQARASEMAPGVYRAHVVWPRAGSWFVVVYITFANGQTLMRQVELPYVQAH